MLDDIAIGDSVFHSYILVLLRVILIGLHDAHGRESHFVERTVMPATAETIKSIDHHHIKIRDEAIGHRVDVACKIT